MSKTIHKAAAVIIRGRKLLITRTHGQDIFIAPGGKLEPGETSVQALVREMREEQGITLRPEEVNLLGSYHALAAGQEADDVWLTMDTYLVDRFDGELHPQAEIAENLWWDSSMTDVEQGSIFAHEVIPELLRRGLID